MNIKRAFLAAVAVLMVPGSVMAQSVVNFDVGANFFGNDGDTMAYLTCNAGLPLEQEYGPIGGMDRVTFSVTDFVPGFCEVSFGDAPDGLTQTGVNINGGAAVPEMTCLFDDGTNGTAATADNMCTAVYAAEPVDFSVTVMWEVSQESDPGVGALAQVALMCEEDDGNGYTSTTQDAAPGDTMPVVLEVIPPAYCNAYLMGVGSAVEVDSSDCNGVDIGVNADAEDGECTIYATAFYEGIPTLSQYGMAIMVLLMLGVGFVGFRRFV